MNIQLKSLKFFSICAFLSVISTIGIHSDLLALDVNEYVDKISLYKSLRYNLERWWIIVHCLLVLITMWGVRQLKFDKSPLAFGLGFIFYAVFSFTEILRQFLGIFYLNGLKVQFELSQNSDIQAHLQAQIDGYSLISYALFGMFIFAFSFGNLFFGMGLVRGMKWDKILGWLLFVWGIIGLLTLGNEFWEINWLSKFIGVSSSIYQPFVRLMVGLWFLQQISIISSPKKAFKKVT